MSDDVVIKVENLSKQYRIGAKEGYRTFRETLVDAAKAPFARLRSVLSKEHGAQHSGSYPMPYAPGSMPSSQHDDYIWALKNVSFEVKQGEVIGIIGRNGAGKSTLLKILSKITEPTEGRVELRGRVGSLLEVGTGFHPELTGHENVYMYGAILGMDRWEVTRKFDEIVGFAELEKFIETPVKRYSSGMYMRLAFSVAAHLEPEILLVDEVLAVGDTQFQKKCLGKMDDVSKEGRTVLFVSHNMGAIRTLCGSAVWLHNGKKMKTGSAYEVINEYEDIMMKHFEDFSNIEERDPEEVKNSSFYISRVEMLNVRGQHTNIFKYGEHLVLILDFSGELTGDMFSTEFYLYNELRQLVSGGGSGPYHGKYFNNKVRRIRIDIGPLIITSGKYRISFSLMAGEKRIDTWESAIAFTIVECQPFATNWEIPTYREGVCVLQQSFCEIE